MGFFYNASRGAAPAKGRGAPKKHIPVQTMREMGCKACPLDTAPLHSPKMQPSGTASPSLYILGEAPGETEDKEGAPFLGKPGRLLRSCIPARLLEDEIRIGNTIRCRPPDNRTPELAEIECCRNWVADDIAASKPLVVIGAGGVPLSWATGLTNVTAWRGRTIATRIGGHDCWYFPILHPSYVLRKQSKYGKSEYERVFEHDLDWITRNYNKLPRAHTYDAPYDRDITLIEGAGVKDFNALEDALNRLATQPSVGIDIESSGLRPYANNSAIYMCSIGTFDDTVAFPIDDPRAWNSTLRRKVHSLLVEFLLESRRKVAHNLGFELEWFTYFYGERIAYLTEWDDTMARAHTIDERIGTLGLGDLTRQWFGFDLKAQSNVDPKRLLEYPIRDGLRYNGMDAKWTQLLDTTLAPVIDRDQDLINEYERKIRLAPALVLTQLKGIAADADYARSLQEELSVEVAQIEKNIRKCPEVQKYEKAYGAFLPSSPDHVLKMMDKVCDRPEVRKEGGGGTSDEAALSKIPAKEVPSAPMILELRGVTKLISTYIDPVVTGRVLHSDGLIHTKFGSMVAITGRLNSEDPNVQNYPKRKHKKVRGMIVPLFAWWLALDYGQLEARIIAMASEDPNLVKALWTSYDIHGFWADRFLEAHPKIKDRIIADYKVSGDDAKLIRKKFRDEIKNGWVFPQFFGSTIRSCAQNLQVPESIADDLGKEFWDEFRGVKRWQGKLLKAYERNLYVETLTGRRRRGLVSHNEIINTPIQGTGADIVTASMAELAELSLIEDDPFLCPNINIHDDLTFDMIDEDLDIRLPKIAAVMCRHRFDFINVPVIVEASLGRRWHELEEVAVYRSNEIYSLRSPYA